MPLYALFETGSQFHSNFILILITDDRDLGILGVDAHREVSSLRKPGHILFCRIVKNERLLMNAKQIVALVSKGIDDFCHWSTIGIPSRCSLNGRFRDGPALAAARFV